MRPFQALFRVAGVLTLLLAADAVYMMLSHYGPSDQNPILGGYGVPAVNLSDAATVLVAAGFLALLTALCALQDRRWLRERGPARARDHRA